MTSSDDDLAVALEELLRAVPGVIAIYPSAPLPAVIVGAVLAQHTPLTAPRLVSVSTARGEIRVTAAIGVDDESPAQATGLAAHDLIVDYLVSRGAGAELSPRVTVRIGMVG